MDIRAYTAVKTPAVSINEDASDVSRCNAFGRREYLGIDPTNLPWSRYDPIQIPQMFVAGGVILPNSQ
jgi:hypothetical protein